jgi:lipopolysaccharide transport system permease protein
LPENNSAAGFVKIINPMFHYINLIQYKAWADLRSEARRYYISYLWWVFEPIIEMLIFYMVFGLLLKQNRPNYIQFLLIGLTTWKWFATTIQHAGNSILNSRGLIGQVSLPKTIFPLIVVCTDTFKFAIVFSIIMVFILLSGFAPSPAYVLLPLLMLTQLAFLTALGIFFSAIIPFVPDLDILLENSLRFVFYLSGVFFDPQSLSPETRFWFYLNPMAYIVDGYRQILMHGQMIEIDRLLVILALSLAGIFAASRLVLHFDKIYPRVVAQ